MTTFDALARDLVLTYLAGRAAEPALLDLVCWATAWRLRDELVPALDERLQAVLSTPGRHTSISS